MPINNAVEIETQFLKKKNVMMLDDDITFYIRESGMDTNSGRTEKKAWKTLKHAYSYIKEHVYTNGHCVKIDIENGVYKLDNLCHTALILSPATLDDDKIVIEKQEYEELTSVNAQIKKLENQNNRLEKKLELLSSQLSDVKQETKRELSIEKILELNNKLEKKLEKNIQGVENTFKNVLISTTKEVKSIKALAETVKTLSGELHEAFTETRNNLSNVANTVTINSRQIASIDTELNNKIVRAGKIVKKEVNQVTLQLETTRDLLGRKIEKLKEDIEGQKEEFQEYNKHQADVNKQYYSRLNSIEKKYVEHIHEDNPHNIKAKDILFGKEISLQGAIEDLYSKIKQTVIDTYVVKLEEKDNLNEILFSLANTFDFQHNDVIIDLNKTIQTSIDLINIPTAANVIICNGTIQNGIEATEILTTFKFKDIVFAEYKDRQYTIKFRNCNAIHLDNISIKGMIWLQSSYLLIDNQLTFNDKSCLTLIRSDANSTVIANHVHIVPPANRKEYSRLLCTDNTSKQLWYNCKIEADKDLEEMYIGNVRIID